MSYYFTKTIKGDDINKAIDTLKLKLSEKGFGIVSEINVDSILKEKLNKDLRPYKILGACHPESAYTAISKENKIGTLLPCNFIVQELNPREIEVSAVDPAASMSSVNNEELIEIATKVRETIKSIVEKL